MDALAFQGNPCFDVLTATQHRTARQDSAPGGSAGRGQEGTYGRGGERDEEMGRGYNRCPIQPRVTSVESVTLARDRTATAKLWTGGLEQFTRNVKQQVEVVRKDANHTMSTPVSLEDELTACHFCPPSLSQIGVYHGQIC